MRYWGKNISIDGSWLEKVGAYQANQDTMGLRPYQAMLYEHTVQGLLRQLQNSSVGSAVIQMINQSPRELRIIPHAILSFEQSSAHITTDGKESQCLKQACPSGGSDSVIWFEPQTYTDPMFRDVWDRHGIIRPEDILLHELVHALRIMRGIFVWKTMAHKYDKVEEFYAILLANIYASEMGRSGDLRGDHRAPYHRLKDETDQGLWADSDMIHYMNFQDEVDELVRSMPDLCFKVASLQVAWNPLRRQYWYKKMQGNWS